MANLSAKGEQYVDRGDPAAADFLVGDFTTDNAWRDLDLSGIVPPEAAGRPVYLTITLTNGAGGSYFQVREKGKTNTNNVGSVRTQVIDLPIDAAWIVKMDKSRVIQYRGANVAFTTIFMVVRGWWKPA